MNKVLLFCTSSFLLFASVKAGAQDSFSVRAQRYIEKYYSLAIDEQVRSGIPAAVTLAQGVLETEAGKSELACSANNHFGIKCKSDYSGEKFFHDDDAPKECFKMYRCAEDSYKDHSDYLKRNPRYAPLFALSQTDYASWAVCLKKCGYATNPQYAQRLIKLIEDFKLQQYTYAAMDSSLLPVKPGLKPSAVQPKAAATPQPVTASAGDQIVITTPFPSGKGGTPPPPKDPVKTETPTPAIPKATEQANPAVPITTPVQTPITMPTPPAKEQVKETPAITAKSESKHNIIVTDGPLPLQAKPGTEAIDSPDTKTKATTVQEQQLTQPSLDTKYDSGKVIIVNGLKAFYAYKGDVLLQYAVKYNIRYPHLLEINDLPDGPLEANMPIYLEKKLTSGTHARHTVREGESMYMISQMEGMQLKRLLALNMMDVGDEPATGVILELQNGVYKKPALRATTATPTGGNMTVMLGKSTPPSDLVVINRTKPAPEKRPDTVVAEKPKPYVETVQAPTEKVTTATPLEKVTPATTTERTPAVTTAQNTTPATVAITTTAANTAAPAKDTTHIQPATMTKEDTADELAALKAELDKVVYTDDSKMAAAQSTPSVKPAATAAPVKNIVKAKKKKADDDDDEDDEDDKKKGPNYYTIKDGETLGGIANRHHTTVKKLMQLNHIKATQIRAGKKLRIK